MSDAYAELIVQLKQIALLGSISSVLGWDERVCMPRDGAALRAEQSSLMARMLHERFTSPRVGELLHDAEAAAGNADPHSDVAVNLRQTRRSYDRAVKLPSELVEELAHAEVLSQQAWAEARAKNDFPAFRPWLQKIVELKRRQAACLGGRPYDALLDEFEPGETAENLTTVLGTLRQPLVELVARIAESPRKPPLELLDRDYPVAIQQQLAQQAAAAVGFAFSGGRLDVSAHPFSTGIGPGDARITTRYNSRSFADAFFGVLHESGHAMYSQGLPPEHFGTPRGREVSLGIHESQSRLWENIVGRSLAFWQFFFPTARAAFPAALGAATLDQWHFAINAVRPSLIRVEADEITYNLHILLRFELEQALLSGDLAVVDLPAAWRQKMREYLGLTSPDDARGCLQDIHWSGGAIGYFPTYALGNLYAAQFFQQAQRDLPDLEMQFARGNFTGLLGWLRKNIHSQGMKYTAGELVQKVTGQPLSAEPLLQRLRSKAIALYGI